MKITDDELRHWREVTEKATPEPWRADDGEYEGYVSSAAPDGWTVVRPGVHNERQAADAAFIAAARSAMPRFLDAYEAMRAEVERLRAIVRDLPECDPVVTGEDLQWCKLCGTTLLTVDTALHVYPHADSCPYRRAVNYMKGDKL